MQNFGYKSLAPYYDKIYSRKPYSRESRFVRDLLGIHGAKRILDVGCGTGSHIARLKRYGFHCIGTDLNYEMLSIAHPKVRAPLVQADMKELPFGRSFDAVICMYAAFNHNIDYEDARKTLKGFRNCLNVRGTALIDLHNPSDSGERIDKDGDVERHIIWRFDRKSRIEKSRVVFNVEGNIIEDQHTMRIYTICEMKEMLRECGFDEVVAYENYGFNPANDKSKNIEILGRIKT